MDLEENAELYNPGETLLLPRLPRSLPFDELVFVIESRITEAIDLPYPFDHIHGASFYFSVIRPLVASLIVPYDDEEEGINVEIPTPSNLKKSASTTSTTKKAAQSKTYSFKDQHRGIVAALLVARLEFLDSATDGGKFIQGNSDEQSDAVLFKERGIFEARAFTAELVAMKFLSFMTKESDRIEFLTYEYNIESDGVSSQQSSQPKDNGSHGGGFIAKIGRAYSNSATNLGEVFSETSKQPAPSAEPPTETAPLLTHAHSYDATMPTSPTHWGDSPEDRLIEHSLFVEDYADQNAINLALIGKTPASEFLSTAAVQSVVSGIYSGRIMYWRTIGVGAEKCVHIYDSKNPVDYYSRLRVPRYRSFFMMSNYAILMALFYSLLFGKDREWAPITEFFLDIWFIGFVLDEFNQIRESGSFGQYLTDYWALFDLCIVGIYMTFAGLRLLGFVLGTDKYFDLSMEVLSLEALLLIPRLFSFLSLTPYFGTLLPCLRDIAAEFFKFLIIIAIIYVGFLTTFTFLGRDHYTFEKMSWLLIRVFFGSSFAGFDAAPVISPLFGSTLMLIFVTLTNILLITVLISILSQKFSETMLRAKQEYAIHFSSAVVESVNTSDRLTYFYPPLNILGVLMRPLRLVLDHEQYREVRIKVLRATHWPFVGIVWAFEKISLAYQRYRMQQYMKIRKDRRLSVAQRLAMQPPGFYDRANGVPGMFDLERNSSLRRRQTTLNNKTGAKRFFRRLNPLNRNSSALAKNGFQETLNFKTPGEAHSSSSSGPVAASAATTFRGDMSAHSIR